MLAVQLAVFVESDPAIAEQILYSVIYCKASRHCAAARTKTASCAAAKAPASCPSPAAVHTNPDGSRLAIKHFTEYLEAFPDDLEVRWLLNLAHMTLGEHPRKGRSAVS